MNMSISFDPYIHTSSYKNVGPILDGSFARSHQNERVLHLNDPVSCSGATDQCHANI